MLRFIDKEVYTIQKKYIDRALLFKHFCASGHSTDIIVVYEENKYFGMITYQSLLENSDNRYDKIILREKYVHSLNDWKIIENIKGILEKTGMSIIPVLSEEELIYFAYDEKEIENEVEIVLQCLEEKKADIFLSDIFPQLSRGGVRIFDLNEWAIRFYQILQQYDIQTEIVGEKWEVLFPNHVRFKLNMPEANILKVWAEGTPRFDGVSLQNWLFMNEVGLENHIWITEKYKKMYMDMGINAITMYFPRSLESLTLEEEYRKEMYICMGGSGELWKNENAKEQICKVCGQELSYEEWKVIYHEKRMNHTFLDGKLVQFKTYGNQKNKIYIIGPCIAAGFSVMKEEEEFGACLYHHLKDKNAAYSVVSITSSMTEFVVYEKLLDSLMIKENDIVLLINTDSFQNIVPHASDIPIKDILEKRICDWFYDIPIHTNFIGNQNIAEAVVNDYLWPIIEKSKPDPVYLQLGRKWLSKDESEMLKEYLLRVKGMTPVKTGKQIGAIVMNCNPMTMGHLYLIEQARKQVDFLYIFVVEEDKSEFKFTERFELVKQETDSMDNVCVVPSGEFVLSASTLPLYFEKAEKKYAKLDAGTDLQIFGAYIAPGLKITKRFIGEEINDLVTRQYNEQMFELLPYYGITVIEIPRLTIDGEVISASKVRELIKKHEWEKVKMYVTDETMDFLKRRFNDDADNEDEQIK